VFDVLGLGFGIRKDPVNRDERKQVAIRRPMFQGVSKVPHNHFQKMEFRMPRSLPVSANCLQTA
jgi:hypothetical protein